MNVSRGSIPMQDQRLTVLACDLGNPGGLAVIQDAPGRKPHVLRVLCWNAAMKLDLAQRIVALGREFGIEALAIEKPWTGEDDRRRKVALGQSRKAGAIDIAAEALQIPVREYAPQTVKAAVAGHGWADKPRVARCAALLVELAPGIDRAKITEHGWDAIALGIVSLSREQADRRLAAAGVRISPKRGRRAPKRRVAIR